MKERFIRTFKDSYFFEWYYILVILGYIATLAGDIVRPGIIASLCLGIVVIELFIRKRVNIHSVMDVLIVVYLAYKILTIICIVNTGMPMSVYTGEFVVSVLPMIFYFAGSKASDKKEATYVKIICALALLGLVSLVLYAFAPQFYCDYLYKWSYISKADASTAHVRMQSVVGSTVFGAIMVLGMGISVHFMACQGGDARQKQKRKLGLASLIFTIVFAFLSNQRSCMVTAMCIVVYVIYLLFAVNKAIPKKYILYGIGGIAVVIITICIIRFDFVLKVWWRLESLPGAISQRSEQWVAAVNNMYSSWFGNGLGANGHRALGIEGAHVIADGGLIKTYCEEGVLGFSLFVYILFLTISKAVRGISRYSAELCVIVSVLMLSIGSNVMAFQLVTPIFWYVIGVIWDSFTDEYRLKAMKRR